MAREQREGQDEPGGLLASLLAVKMMLFGGTTQGWLGFYWHKAGAAHVRSSLDQAEWGEAKKVKTVKS